MRRLLGGIGLQVAVVAVLASAVALAILAAGVWVIGGESFARLMASHGQDAAVAHSMFEESVAQVLIAALGAAILGGALLAALLAARLARPLREARDAAQKIAEGDLQARLARRGPQELVELADSFNSMAAALDEQERARREFTANAAHELRTPLTNLQGYLEALRDGVVTPDRATFESLWEEADRLVRLSRDLDQLAEGDAGRRASVETELDLGETIRAAVELARPAARAKGLELALDLDGPMRVHADHDRMVQILANLLQNAVRYSEAGGRVRVSAERRARDVLVAVTNTGDGIPAADVPRVFERFYRVEKSRDRERGGAGIGLAIVRQLVEAAGGRVGAESSAGTTRFWFTVPG